MDIAINASGRVLCCFSFEGFKLFNVESRELTYSGGNFTIDSLKLIQDSSCLFLISSIPQCCIRIWDCKCNHALAILQYRLPILDVQMSKLVIVVVLSECAFVYNTENLELRLRVDTCSRRERTSGVRCCVISQMICLLGPRTGSVILIESTEIGTHRLIQAHNNEICCMSLDNTGALLATASTSGTVVRVYDTKSLELLKELRRGTSLPRSEILNEVTHIQFNFDSSLLAVADSKNQILLFSLRNSAGEEYYWKTPENVKAGSSVFGMGIMRSLVPKSITPQFLNSEWSFANCAIPIKSVKVLLAFPTLSLNELYVFTAQGDMFIFQFDVQCCKLTGSFKLFSDASFD